MKKATEVIHGKRKLGDRSTRALSVPIYQSAVFTFENAEHGAALFAGEKEGYIYTRLGNPTHIAFEEKMAELEGGEAGCAFGSGMAAISHTVLALCKTGDRVIASAPIYGGTYSLLNDLLPRWQIEVVWVPAGDFAGTIEKHITSCTKLLLTETPANPTMDMVDIGAAAQVARKHKIALAVDNTFATSYFQRPLELGADIVLHSATKFISGHGDTVGGIVVGRADFIKDLKGVVLRDLGGIISPFNAWLLLRGLKTLAVRMERHSENGMKVARFLEKHPKIAKVYYPGLESFSQFALAKKQMSGFGGMLAFDVKGGRDAGRRMLNAIKLCVLAISLGDTATLIEHPASMTHSIYSAEELAKTGIGEGLVRMSVGLEDPDDIIADLDQALKIA